MGVFKVTAQAEIEIDVVARNQEEASKKAYGASIDEWVVADIDRSSFDFLVTDETDLDEGE